MMNKGKKTDHKRDSGVGRATETDDVTKFFSFQNMRGVCV